MFKSPLGITNIPITDQDVRFSPLRDCEELIIMRPSSLGGGRILRRTLSVRLSVCLSVRPVIITERHVAAPSELK